MNKEQQRLIRLEFTTTDTNAKLLEKSLLSLKNTRVQMKRPEREAKMAYSAAFAGLPQEQIFMLILTIGSNLATIAGFLYAILHDRKNKEQSIVFRLGKKKLEISGQFSKNDLELILEKFAETVTSDEQVKLLDDQRRIEFEKELSNLKEVLPTYRKLTKPEEWKKSKEALKKLKEYQERQKEIEDRIAVIEKILSN